MHVCRTTKCERLSYECPNIHRWIDLLEHWTGPTLIFLTKVAESYRINNPIPKCAYNLSVIDRCLASVPKTIEVVKISFPQGLF